MRTEAVAQLRQQLQDLEQQQHQRQATRRLDLQWTQHLPALAGTRLRCRTRVAEQARHCEAVAGSPPRLFLHIAQALGPRPCPGAALSPKLRRQIEHEFTLIDELNYAPYFLTVHDLVVYARSRGILCQGRGAAANSAVCYCLGVTSVDPERIDMLFERFVSRERNEPPDIDIDFEHERREEVIQYIYRKYGRDRAALCAEVVTYRGRSAVRDVGKALGLSLDAVDRLAKNMDWWDPIATGSLAPDALHQMGFDPDDPTMGQLAQLVTEILGFPRHLSQHVGGFVITRTALEELVPIENAAMPDRTVIEWDKDDIEAMGMLKVDVLGLGMLTCLGKGFALVEEATKRRSDEGGGRGNSPHFSLLMSWGAQRDGLSCGME